MEIIELKTYSTFYFEAIRELCKELLSGTCDFSEEYIQEIIKSENSHLFLILEDKSVMGMLSLGTYKTPLGVKAWIEDVVVDSRVRGRGLGKKITLHAIEFAKNLGADRVMLTSKPSRVAANKLYQSLGFEKVDTNFYRIKLDSNN